jgi:hypothetical protein
MKEVLSVLTFSIAALCFAIFLTVVKPNAVSAVPGESKSIHCETEASSLPVCRPDFPDEARASAPSQ